ncbi:hypothetical protein, partial [Shigella boydii]|uniref:hypothetical protein n=1 Tax=Shigella boydii TaxID=621 RepID=UPI00093DB359
MKTSDNERIKYEITGQAVLQILRMKINFSLQTLIKQLLVMKSAEEDAFRRDLIDSIIGNDSNLLIVFYVQIMPDDLVMQL